MHPIPIPWGVALDLLCIGLCAVIVLFLILNRIKYRKWVLTVGRRNYTVDFGNEVMARLTYQRFERSLAAIMQALESERQTFQKWVENNDAPLEWTPAPAGQAVATEMPDAIADYAADREIERMKREATEAAYMAVGGMGVDEICEKSMLPREGVELIVQMNQNKRLHSDPSIG